MFKLLYVALTNISKKWTMPIREWKTALNQFCACLRRECRTFKRNAIYTKFFIYPRFLFPLLQAWPTPSTTAETLLVRRDGERVLFTHRHPPPGRCGPQPPPAADRLAAGEPAETEFSRPTVYTSRISTMSCCSASTPKCWSRSRRRASVGVSRKASIAGMR